MYYKDIDQFKELAGYEIDGFWYPRVTKIMEIKSKPELYRFYANLPNFDAGEKIKSQSASEGTLVHEAVEGILLGKNPEIPPEILPSVQAFVEFTERNKIQVDKDFVEKRLVNYEERYAGTLDAIALIGGKLGILDIKTSMAIYRDYNLQTSAYIAAMKDQVKGLETRWILRIDQVKTCKVCGATMRSKGGRDKIRYEKIRVGRTAAEKCEHDWGPVTGLIEIKEFPYWHEDFHAFLGAKRLWEWENEFWLKKVGYN